MPCPTVRLAPELARLSPREVIVTDRNEGDLADIVTESGASLTPLSASSFDSTNAAQRLCDLF